MISLAMVGLLLATPAPSVGIAPSPAAICFTGAVSPGHDYYAGIVTWRNTGNVTETVTFSVNKSPAGSWVSAGASVILNPGNYIAVPVQLNVPSNAIEHASYTARIIATASSSAADGNSALRTSAGVDVGFAVGQRPDCAPAVSPAVSAAVSSSPSPAARKSSSSGLIGGLVVVGLIAAALMFTQRRRRRTTRTTRTTRTHDDEDEGNRRDW